MPYDWNNDGRIDWEDQMVEDDFDDFVLNEVKKRRAAPPPVRRTQTDRSTKIRATIVPSSNSKNKVPLSYRHGRAYRQAWIKANIPHMVILGIAFLSVAWTIGMGTGPVISLFLTLPFAMFVCRFYVWEVPNMNDLVGISVAQSRRVKHRSPKKRAKVSQGSLRQYIPLLVVLLLGVVVSLCCQVLPPYEPANPPVLMAAEHYYKETGKEELEERLRSCWEEPLEDLRVEALSFKKAT